MPAPANKKPIMDVAKPGDTAATATSRPVIINHGMLVKDPMMQDKGDEAASELVSAEETPQKLTQSKKIIAPIVAQETTESKQDDSDKAETADEQSDESSS